MRILTISLILICFSACASVQRTKTLNFDAVKNLVGQASTQDQIETTFGKPTVVEQEGRLEKWIYSDPSGNQNRTSIVFNEEKNIVKLTWFPIFGEPESAISAILAKYPKGYFKHVRARQIAIDSQETETSYTNGSTMGILYDDVRKRVEAVLWSMPSEGSEGKGVLTSK